LSTSEAAPIQRPKSPDICSRSRPIAKPFFIASNALDATPTARDIVTGSITILLGSQFFLGYFTIRVIKSNKLAADTLIMIASILFILVIVSRHLSEQTAS
jgi:hypothetical protein